MKRPYFLIQGLLILSFGLISCGSDEGSGQSDTSKTYNLEIRNLDETLQEIESTQSLRVSSEIVLKDKKTPIELEHIQASTQCRSTLYQQVLEFSTSMQDLYGIPVKNLLPVEAFTPTEQNVQMVCDVNLDIQIAGGQPILVKLKDVEVLGINEYFSEDWPVLRDQQTYLKTDDLEQRSWQWPAEEGTITTLCESDSHQSFLLPNATTPIQLFYEHIFLDKNFQTCRIHFRYKDQAWISPKVKVQHRQPELETKMIHNFPGNASVSFNDQPVITWNLRNKTPHTVYFKLALPHLNVYLESIYRQAHFDRQKSVSLNIPGVWTATGMKLAKKGANDDENIYLLNSGEEIAVQLVLQGGLKCGQGLFRDDNASYGATHSQKLNCVFNQANFLNGYRYSFSRTPRLSINQFSSLETEEWKNRLLSPPSKYYDGNNYQMWGANTEILNLCPNFKIEAPRTKSKVTPLPVVGDAQFCQYFK